jgi:D-aminoacyl-tRNA deacylase
MICVVQRVTEARVTVADETVGAIALGLLVLASVHKGDMEKDIAWTAQKLAGLRIFPNADKAYDLDVRKAGGKILLVSNFTVAADTSQGRRPSLSYAADPAKAQDYFAQLVDQTRAQGVPVETGRFREIMKVQLVNDGPCTFLVDSRKPGAP